ncbi:MAG: SAM-dependent methyltransferase [Bacteroidaceae bacterium]|nr:SAM-dependent methyltransferase [Bacteroidaceae bacterium]
MDTTKLNQLTKDFSIEEIEKHIVFDYLTDNNINFINSQYVNNYLDGFKPKDNLLRGIASIGISSIEEMASVMELLIPFEDKKVNGAFFTPAYIADYIIKTISPAYDAKIIDPSCGSGAFLLAIVRYYIKTYNKGVADCIRENVYGADILSYNIHRSELLLTILALSHNEIIEISDINLICCDSLKQTWQQKFDAVLGNPPYVKFQDMDDDTRKFLLSKFKTTQFGTYNLYFAFFELGIQLLKETGKLGYITPNNYFTSLAGECLRSFFQNEQYLYQIVDFNATKVFNVQTYTAISFINKVKNPVIRYDRIKNGSTPQKFLKTVNYTENPYSSLSDKKWRLLCGAERENIAKIESCGESIGNLFNICVGIATLKDEVYFFVPLTEDSGYYYTTRDNLVFAIEKELTRPVVKISDMKTAEDIEHNQRRIIFPYVYVNGKATTIIEDTMASKYPKCYEYFLYVKDILKSRGKGKQTFTPFYAYGRTQGLNRTGVKLLTPTFSKSPRFLFDKNPQGLFTNGYGVYLKERVHSLFDCNPISQEDNLDVIQKILNSFVMEYYVDKTSVAIEGGYPCYQKNFIERFSIPELTEHEINILRSMEAPFQIDEFLVSKYQLNLDIPNRS